MKNYLKYIVFIIIGFAIGFAVVKFSGSEGSSAQANASSEPIIWTCSMHPEIQSDEPGLCPLCNMDLTPMEADTEGFDPNLFQLSERALALADVQTLRIYSGKADNMSMQLTGTIQATDAANKTQSAYVSGRIERLFVNTTGQIVNQGQVLAHIYAPDLLAAQKELLSTHKRKDQNPGLYNAVRNKLKQWKMTDAQIDAVISSNEAQAIVPIYAMNSGELIERFVSEGSYVEAGESLFEIADLSKVWAVLNLPESQVNQLKEGDEIQLQHAVKGDFSAKISQIHAFMDPNTRSVEVRAEIPNADRSLKPGMLVKAKVESSLDATENLWVPKSAVLWTGKKSVIYIVHREQGQMAFEMREVELGTASTDQYEITDGLADGEEVVVYGTFTIDAAAQLQGRESMMNRLASLKISLSDEDKEKLVAFMPFYFELKDIFVSSDGKEVEATASAAEAGIADIGIVLEDQAHELWFDVQNKWKQIAKTDDIEKQRYFFKDLNESLLPILKAIESYDTAWYIQECPMADGDTGARWLSLEKSVINPYFGDAMLRCGSVEEILQ